MPRSLRFAPLVILFGASSAFAIFPNNGPETGFSSVVQVAGESGVAIDSRWVLTAKHVDSGTVVVNGTTYNVIENHVPSIVFDSTQPSDLQYQQPELRLLKVDADLPVFTRIDTRLPLLGTVNLVGYGISGRELPAAGGYDLPPGPENASGIRRRATNRIEGTGFITLSSDGISSNDYPAYNVMYYDLTAPGGEGRTANEGGLASGDSGGGFFYDFGEGTRLVATSSAIGYPDGVTSPYSYGAYGFGTYLGDPMAQSFIRTYVPQAIVPEPASMAVLGVGALALLRRRRAR